MKKLPGYYENGQDFLPEHAVPYIYWNGQSTYRIYRKPEGKVESRYLISDFGNLSGLTIGETDSVTYCSIIDAPEDY